MARRRITGVMAYLCAVFLAPVALAACDGAAAKGSKTAATEEPAEVETVVVREAPMPRILLLSGSLRGEEESELAAATSGRAEEVLFDRNSEVKLGDVMVRLDVGAAALTAAEARANAKNADVQVSSAEREEKRAAKLHAGGAISAAEYERLTSELEAAKARAKAAKARAALGQKSVSDGLVRAPFSGVVSERYVDPGEFLMPGARVATLVSIDHLRLDVQVPESHLAALAPGAEVGFRVSAYPERAFTGKVKLIGAIVRAATRDVLVEVTVENTDRALRPGMFATVEIHLGDAPSAVVPQKALVARGDRKHVFVVRGDRLEERVVSVGVTKGDDVAVLRGLVAGDKVVMAPAAELKNGQAVAGGIPASGGD
jgi:membrane fusion protein, multidrug efflux system